jgi:hypothetical protein
LPYGFNLLEYQLVVHSWHSTTPEFCDSVSISGLVLYEIKELWRVALLISTLSYPQVGSFSQAELQRRKEKYVRVELLITDLGKELN